MPDGKTQWVRLLDVFVLGPLMIYIAARSRIREPQRTLLLLTGIGTIVYNGVNFLQIRERYAADDRLQQINR